MKAVKIAALGLLLAATTAEAQKAPAGQTSTGGKPAPTTGAAATPEATVPDTGATPDAGTASTTTATAAPASGNLIVASDPQGVASAMQGLGYTATLGMDNTGDPIVNGAIDGVPYSVVFFGCESNTNCKWLLFSAGYDLPNGTTLDVINTWNQNNLVGQAYLDAEQDPFLNYFVTTTGGLTPENFADAMDWWKVAMGNFQDAIGFQK